MHRQAFNQLSFVMFLHLMIRQDNQNHLHLAHNAAPNHKAHAAAMHGHSYPWTCEINEKTGPRNHFLVPQELKDLWDYVRNFSNHW
jgi:hypothetical protein